MSDYTICTSYSYKRRDNKSHFPGAVFSFFFFFGLARGSAGSLNLVLKKKWVQEIVNVNKHKSGRNFLGGLTSDSGASVEPQHLRVLQEVKIGSLPDIRKNCTVLW